MRYLLDTNVCIAAMRKQPQVVSRMAQLLPTDCGISAVSTFEILTGVAKCSNPAGERSKVEALLKIVDELPFDAAAATNAALTRAQLESQGLTIGPFDLLIAGHALSRGLILVTNNWSEFQRVPRLLLENWQTTSPTVP